MHTLDRFIACSFFNEKCIHYIDMQLYIDQTRNIIWDELFSYPLFPKICQFLKTKWKDILFWENFVNSCTHYTCYLKQFLLDHWDKIYIAMCYLTLLDYMVKVYSSS